MSDNVEIVTIEEIRARQARIIEQHPEILSFKIPTCGCSSYCGDWEVLPPGSARAIDEMCTYEWLAGGDKWDWLSRS